MPGQNDVVRVVDGREIPGVRNWAFFRTENGGYRLAPVDVYQDGVIECAVPMDVEEFRRRLNEGRIVTSLPDGAWLAVPFGAGRITGFRSYYTRQSLLQMVIDDIERLNGRPTGVERCMQACERFCYDPTGANLAALRDAYECLPGDQSRLLDGLERNRQDRDPRYQFTSTVLHFPGEAEEMIRRAAAERAAAEPAAPDDAS